MALALYAPAAVAGPGFELDSAEPIPTGAKIPLGIAIDQTSEEIYVAELTSNIASSSPGQLEQLEADGTPTEYSPFLAGSKYFTGVAISPLDHSVYAYQTEIHSPIGNYGTQEIDHFSATGELLDSFVPGWSPDAQLAVDGAGLVYYPNLTSDTVQVFDSTGALKSSLTCSGCPGGVFEDPVSVALDSTANLYVTDFASGGRATKLKLSGGAYVYDSTLQTGAGALGLGVDPVSDDVFVGDLEGGRYHVVAFDSSGTQFDDFGDGLFTEPPFDLPLGGQIAVSEATRKVYVPDGGGEGVLVFDRVASIPAPTASTSAPSPLGQQEATFRAQVNPHAHGLTDCHFEYVKAVDFAKTGFAGAKTVTCTKFGGSSEVTVSKRAPGLTPATAYDYRIVVASNGGSIEGAAHAFETLPPLPPLVSTGSTSAVTFTSATIGGSVNPRGGTISNCHFEYTDQAHFQASGFAGATSTACLPKPSGTTSIPVSAAITGLSPGTAYHFRVLATSNAGSGEGGDQSFATQGGGCESDPALCPPPEPSAPAPVQQLPAPVPPPKKPLKCRKGFKKKKVHGKARCVRVKRRRAGT